jgi:hypothetical protein
MQRTLYNGSDVTIRCNSQTKRIGVTLAEDLDMIETIKQRDWL